MEVVLKRPAESLASAETRSSPSAAPAPSASLDTLLARFAKLVRSRLRVHDLRRHGIDEDDVEQDIRIRLWCALRRDPACELSGAYVQKVVLSAVIDAFRRERTRRGEATHDLHAVEAVHPDHARPESLLAQNQWIEQLRLYISRLPVRRQRPVRLFLLGYTMQELSDINGLTLDAGSKLVRRGLSELRAMLSRSRERP